MSTVADSTATEQKTIKPPQEKTTTAPAKKPVIEYVINGNTIFTLFITILIAFIGFAFIIINYINAGDAGLRNEIQSLREETQSGFESLRNEMQSGFENINNQINEINNRIDDLLFYLLENEQNNTEPTESTQ